MTLLASDLQLYRVNVIGRLADALQLTWGLLYWNLRKTRFRFARGRIPCPCQSLSDSGRAMETRCEPSLLLHQPGRFRHVCPLLKQAPDGRWRCSVDTPHVQPFWFRAFTFFFTSLLLAYLAATLSVWGFLRWRGYTISYAGIAWPREWSQFRLAQSHFFVAQANQALAKSDLPAALMALSVAYQKDRENYAVGRTFARLAQVSQPALSDRVYMQLAADHPAHRAETLAAWYEALLWRADFRGMIEVAREALVSDSAHSSPWLNAFVFALRRQPNEAVLRELSQTPGSAALQSVVNLELQTKTPSPAARTALLQDPPPGSPSYLAYYRPKRLIELGFAPDALALLGQTQDELPIRDQVVLRLEAAQSLGLRGQVHNALKNLIAQLNPTTAELIAAFLIRHPDPEFFREAFDAYKKLPQAKDEATYRTWGGWLCAAGANGDFERFHEAGAALKSISGSEFRTLHQIEEFFRGDNSSLRVETYLPIIEPIPLEVTYALLEHYYRPRTAVKIAP